ncbi:MAG TPA: DUF1254 domain-containing protein [Ramlibacter sp.]|nr:DUF1254 domain-containing protein [Ramlibacter sp.]
MERLLRIRFAAMLGAALTLLAPAARAAAPDNTEALIRRAFVYSFPLREMGRLWLGDALRMGLPQFNHRRELRSAADRNVTTPNNDTLYSTAWLNLARGPVKLTVPDTQERYYSVAMLDTATDNFAIVGRRTTGTRAGEFVIVGPGWIGSLPEGARVIRAPANDVLLLLRLVVDGPADLAQAHRLQDGFRLTPLQRDAVAAGPAKPPSTAAAGAAPAPAPRAAALQAAAQMSAGERYVTIVNRMLARNPPPSYERLLLEQFAAVGICGAACSWDALPPELQARWNTLLPVMLADLERHSHEHEQRVNGWSHPPASVGDFGTQYELRAETALTGLLALEPAEALYLTARQDGANRPLEGTHTYRLHVPPGSIPVNGFWSLTMYEQDMDGHLYFVGNSIGRYAIGDRTRGLRRNRDGSMDIWIQRADPGRARASNWLPAPPGPFVLVLRAYEPKIQLRDGRFAMPPVDRME